MRSPAVTLESTELGQVEQASSWESSVPKACPLDSIVRAGPRAMLHMELDQEGQECLDRYYDLVDTQGRRLVVRNGHLSFAELLTGVGLWRCDSLGFGGATAMPPP
jgi:hypothetical protein